MTRHIGRREFLQVTGSAAAAAMMANVQRAIAFAAGIPSVGQQDNPDAEGGSSNIDWNSETLVFNEIYGNPPLLGRVHFGNRLSIFTEPSPNSGRVRNVFGGYVGPVWKAVHGERYDSRGWSDVWYETNDGYLHSSFFIPCHEVFHEPEEVTGNGFWGEVTVPYSYQHRRPSFEGYRYDYDHYKIMYGQVHRVIERADDELGNAWYRLYDDIEPNRQGWVQAKTIRHILPEELHPISPEVADKKIVIDLGKQFIHCYEAGVEVFVTRIASGKTYYTDKGEAIDFSTPEGAYHVQRKRPSRRMRSSPNMDPSLKYDINGVPWCTYFSFTGAAVHGAHWHNNFGIPRSHGCINVLPDAGKWIFRWSQPYLGYDDDYHWVEDGEVATPIEIVL